MKVMVMLKATADSEAGAMPDEKLMEAMIRYNEEMVRAGILLAAEGLYPSSKGVRIRFSGADRTFTDGPFAETKELLAGYWLWQVNSMEEAIEWIKRCPNPSKGEAEIEIRPILSMEDCAASDPTGELRERVQKMEAAAEAAGRA